MSDPVVSTSHAHATPTPLVLDPRTFDRALSCVHCGLCLPACPTYTTTHHEADSPRGRIQLMRALAEGQIDPTASVRLHLDLCLDCRACETACPSGVVYHELIEESRSKMPAGAPHAATAEVPGAPGADGQGGGGMLMRWLTFHVFPYPARLKLALLPARLIEKAGLLKWLRKSRLVPDSMRKLLEMLPPGGAMWPRRLEERPEGRHAGTQARRHEGEEKTKDEPKEGSGSSLRSEPGGVGEVEGHRVHGGQCPPCRRPPRVLFFAGCIGSVMYEGVNRKAVELLLAAGCEVIVPRAQVCCGAIHHHNGDWETARKLARANIEAFLAHDPDHITTTIAGCGAMLREYDHLLRDDPAWAEAAKRFVGQTRDVTQVLAQVGLPPMEHAVEARVTYHDACHLAHAQQVTAAPRELLAKIPGLALVPLPESDMCCGAAGTYNLTQPAMARTLATRKLQRVRSTGATMLVAGNVGCALHIAAAARETMPELRIVHPVELLHQAAFGPAND